MAGRTITIEFSGGPLDGETEELEVSGHPPLHLRRRQPVPVSIRVLDPDDEFDLSDMLGSSGVFNYELREGPGLIGRTGDGGWIYDFKGLA